jgi:excisionase family DNA binding protein
MIDSDPARPQLLTPEETAVYLRVKTQTLATWRCTQRYALPYVRVGRAIRYRLTDVREFIAARTTGALKDNT